MAYYLTYFADAKDQQGHYVRVEVHSKTYDSNAPYRMWGLTGLSLNVQGGTDKIDSPIIKTSLSFSLVEPPTPSYDYDMDRRRQKRGGWSEFFTPESDAYKVILMTGSSYGNWTTRWSGYITPDSWQESLDGYDSVTIVARDNLGHLQDFDFDEQGTNGLISINELISKAMTKITVPMSYYIRVESTESERCLFFEDEDGELHTINEACINVSLFEGKNWYEALESTLESIGWVCRWTDYNALSFMPLRNMPLMGYADGTDQPIQSLEFYNGGTRTLDPAYKEIKEEIDYEQKDKVERDAKYNLSSWWDTENSIVFHVESLTVYGQSAWVEAAAPIRLRWTATSEDGWSNISTALKPNDYELQDYTQQTEGEAAKDYLFIAANIKYNQTMPGGFPATWNRRVQSTACKVRFEFTEHPMCLYPQTSGKLGTYQYNLKLIKYRVHYTKGSDTYYWDGYSWILLNGATQADVLTKQFDPENEAGSELEIQLYECTALGPNGKLSIEFSDIQYVNVMPYGFGYGCYARVKSVTIENSQKVNLKKNTITTINNADYNVKCKRTPAFSPLLKTVGFTCPENYKAAMFKVDGTNIYCWPYNCRWDGTSEQIPFPVQVHKQILQYHHITNEVLEGQAGAVMEEADGNDPIEYPLIYFDRIFYYKGKKHLLLSANLDLLTGRLTSAIFREYLTWEELWD